MRFNGVVIVSVITAVLICGINANESISLDSVRVSSYAVSDIYVIYAPSLGRFKGFEINTGIYNLFNKAYFFILSKSRRIYGLYKYYRMGAGKKFQNKRAV